jgi:hypothetical protein
MTSYHKAEFARFKTIVSKFFATINLHQDPRRKRGKRTIHPIRQTWSITVVVS